MSRHEFENGCSAYEVLLEDYLSGELAEPDRERVAAHISSCPACTEALNLATIGRRLLHNTSEPSVEPGPFFARKVMAAIQSAEKEAAERASFWKPLEVLALRAAWSASAALVLLLTYGAISGIPSRPPVAEMRPADPAGLFPDPVNQALNPEDVLTYAGDTNNGN